MSQGLDDLFQDLDADEDIVEVGDDFLGPPRPLALVAEDKPSLRDSTVRSLRRRGIAAISVGSYSQAASALTVSPHIDVALLDIHLDEDADSDDKSGIQIARLLRSSTETTQIIGYSGRFRDESLSEEERELFDDTQAKGPLSHEVLVALWDLCAERAVASYGARRDAGLEHLARLRALYVTEFPAIEILRRFRVDDPNSEMHTAEGALGLAGYKIRIVRLENEDFRTRPFVIWQQRVIEDGNEWTNVEVYDEPRLYASGVTEEDALDELAGFMMLVWKDLSSRPERSASDESLHLFLQDLLA